jgi:hypothetical protein
MSFSASRTAVGAMGVQLKNMFDNNTTNSGWNIVLDTYDNGGTPIALLMHSCENWGSC